MAAAADRLSSLPDKVLKRILSFTPAKEAVASSVLSRRWRNLWLRAGALNLDTRQFGASGHTYDAFIRAAAAALAPFGRAGGPRLRKVTLFKDRFCCRTGYHSHSRDDRFDLVDALLVDPATVRLKELHVDCDDYNLHFPDNGCAVQLAFLPCAATLRRLELANCEITAPTNGGLDFPRQTSLILRSCVMPEGYLQEVVAAAPKLAILHLHSVRHEPAPTAEPEEETERRCYRPERRSYLLRFRLHCPQVTEIVLVASGGVTEEEVALSNSGIELDVPNLQSFSYKGWPVRLALTQPMPNLARVDIDDSGREGYHRDRYRCYYSEDRRPKKLVPLSCMIRSFRDTRVLRLRANCIEDIVDTSDDDDRTGRVDSSSVLPVFHNLRLLELVGCYKYMNKDSAATMACLLASCPALSELRLKLTMSRDYRYSFVRNDPEKNLNTSLDQFRFTTSIDRFKGFKTSMVSSQASIEDCCPISELPALSKGTFTCLQTSLRTLHLQFEAKEMDCFEVQLVKFLVENAISLEEIHINDGEKVFWDHLNHKVRKWRIDAFRWKKLPNKGCFAVYHLVDK